ncbi:DNA-directed DNA polymerase [Tanacetum coccineum]
MGTPTLVCVWSCPNFSAPADRPFTCFPPLSRCDRLADGTKSYPVRIVKNVEVHIGKLKLLEDFYVLYMEKDPTTPLLIGRGFLATASAVRDYKKAKIAVGEGVTKSTFIVKEIDLGDEDMPY